jgi:hypothetical protein
VGKDKTLKTHTFPARRHVEDQIRSVASSGELAVYSVRRLKSALLFSLCNTRGQEMINEETGDLMGSSQI